MAEIAYIPQMEVCDIVVDTTGAALWTTPEIKEILDEELHYGEVHRNGIIKKDGLSPAHRRDD